jgi:hypothetical protein
MVEADHTGSAAKVMDRAPQFIGRHHVARLSPPGIYAHVPEFAALEADAYAHAYGVDYPWGHVRLETLRSCRPLAGIGGGDHVEYVFVIRHLQQLTATRPRAMAQAQRMLETFVRASIRRQPIVRIEAPGPTAMLRLRSNERSREGAWDLIAPDVVRFIPVWASIIEHCLPAGDG